MFSTFSFFDFIKFVICVSSLVIIYYNKILFFYSKIFNPLPYFLTFDNPDPFVLVNPEPYLTNLSPSPI